MRGQHPDDPLPGLATHRLRSCRRRRHRRTAGNPANDLHIAHYEGLQSNTEGAHFAFEMDYAGGRVEAVLHASDGQGELTDGSLLWNTLPGRPDQNVANTLKFVRLHDGLYLWPGSSVPQMGHQRVEKDKARHRETPSMLREHAWNWKSLTAMSQRYCQTGWCKSDAVQDMGVRNCHWRATNA